MDRLPSLLALVDAADVAGYALVPVGKDSKVSLTRWDTRVFTRGQLLHHVRGGGNIAARVGETRAGVRVLVVDRDARDRATWEVLRDYRLHHSTMQVETASGNWHLWFRVGQEAGELRTRIRIVVGGTKVPIDLKATGYVLLPGSTIGGKAYRFREGRGFKRPEELLPLPDAFLDLLREESRQTTDVRPTPAAGGGMGRVRTGRILWPERYVLKIASVQGQNGSGALVRCIAVLRDGGWDRRRILAFVRDVWNPACARPPWSEAELVYAVNRHVPGGAR